MNADAYDQPGVEAATELLPLQDKVPTKLSKIPKTVEDIAAALSADADKFFLA